MFKMKKIAIFSCGIALLSSLVITATAVPIIVNNLHADATTWNTQRKIIYDNKIFNNMDEVVSYYLVKNDIVDDGLYFGKVTDAIYDYTNGLLDISKLKKVDYNKVSNAYLNAYGGYEKTKSAALKTFINETRIVTKYSDYNGGLFYEYRDALDSLRSKTTGQIVINSIVTDNNNNSKMINLTNQKDQNALKLLAYLNGISSNKNSDNFKMNYYFNDQNIKTFKENNSSSEIYKKLGTLQDMNTTNSMVDTLVSTINKTLNNRIGYSVALRSKKYGFSDYNLSIPTDFKERINNQWWGANHEIILEDITIPFVQSLSYFNDLSYDSLGNQAVWDASQEKCCDVNTVGYSKNIAFDINSPINNYNSTTLSKQRVQFDFKLPESVKDHYHHQHGFWFGPWGVETDIFRSNSTSYLWFDVKASNPVFYKLGQNNTSKEKTTLQKDNKQQAQQLLQIVISDFFNEKINKITSEPDQKAFELYSYTLYQSLKDNISFMEEFQDLINTYFDYSPQTPNFYGSYNSASTSYARRNIGEFYDVNKLPRKFGQYTPNFSNVFNIEEVTWSFIINILRYLIPVITYNDVPLYKIDINKFINDINVENFDYSVVKETINNNNGIKLNSFQNIIRVCKAMYENATGKLLNMSEYMVNVSQNIDNNEKIPDDNQYNLYRVNKYKNIWIDDFADVNFSKIDFPNTFVEGVGNKLSSLASSYDTKRLVNQITYYYKERTKDEYMNQQDIPIIYDEVGHNLYISSYLGTDFATNEALSDNNITLYKTFTERDNAIANMTSLEPSKISQIIGPNGNPIDIGSSPDSDGFFNSFENVLINAGYEFLVKPSTSYIFYENELISNDINNIYTLSSKNKNLYFVDFNKLKSYLVEVLKLEVQYVN